MLKSLRWCALIVTALLLPTVNGQAERYGAWTAVPALDVGQTSSAADGMSAYERAIIAAQREYQASRIEAYWLAQASASCTAIASPLVGNSMTIELRCGPDITHLLFPDGLLLSVRLVEAQ